MLHESPNNELFHLKDCMYREMQTLDLIALSEIHGEMHKPHDSCTEEMDRHLFDTKNWQQARPPRWTCKGTHSRCHHSDGAFLATPNLLQTDLSVRHLCK